MNLELIKKKTNLIPFFTYKFRWNIEVFFYQHKFQSPQETKNDISYQISKELILSTFVQKIQKSKINHEALEAINSLTYLDDVS